jgi:hypothetical protein
MQQLQLRVLLFSKKKKKSNIYFAFFYGDNFVKLCPLLIYLHNRLQHLIEAPSVVKEKLKKNK